MRQNRERKDDRGGEGGWKSNRGEELMDEKHKGTERKNQMETAARLPES